MNTNRPITEPQMLYLRAMQRKLKLPDRMIDDLCVQRFKRRFAELDIRQASALIEEMKEWQAIPAQLQREMGQVDLPGF